MDTGRARHDGSYPTTHDLTGKRTVVFGAIDPYAAAIALACAEAGADVFVTNTNGDVEEAFALRRLAKKIEALGRRARADSLDISLPTAVQVGVRQLAKALEGIDLAVIAADAPLQRPAESMSDAEWAKTMGLNLNGVFYLCRFVAKEMRSANPDASTKGRIVVLLPELDTATSQQTAYVAARAGVEALVASLSREWASDVA